MEWERDHSAAQCKAVRSSIRWGPALRLESSALTHPRGDAAQLAAKEQQQPGQHQGRLQWPHSSRPPQVPLLSTRCVVSQGAGWDPQHLVGSALLRRYALACWHWILTSKANPNPPSLGNWQKQGCFVRYGTMGLSTDRASKHCPAAEGLSALVWKPADSWQAFGCVSNGRCLELRQTQIDRQYLQSGWHLSGSPLRSPSEFYLQNQGKNNIKWKTKILQSSHTELHLEANLKASFWVTHASPSLLILSLLIMIFI